MKSDDIIFLPLRNFLIEYATGIKGNSYHALLFLCSYDTKMKEKNLRPNVFINLRRGIPLEKIY